MTKIKEKRQYKPLFIAKERKKERSCGDRERERKRGRRREVDK